MIRTPVLTLACALTALSASPALAQSSTNEIETLVAENAVLRAELGKIKAIVDSLELRDRERAKVPAPAGLKVGIVDIGVLFRGYARKDHLEAEINAKRDRMKAEAEERSRKIDVYRRQGTPEQVAQAEAEYQAYMARGKASLEQQVQANTLEILEDLTLAIEIYGLENDFDLVLKVDAAGELSKTDYEEQIFRAQISDVVYSNPTLDVTHAVAVLLKTPPSEMRERVVLNRVSLQLRSMGAEVKSAREDEKGIAIRVQLNGDDMRQVSLLHMAVSEVPGVRELFPKIKLGTVSTLDIQPALMEFDLIFLRE